MAWTTPRTWAVNEQLTAALMNKQVRDNLSYLYDNMQGKLVTGYDYDVGKQSTTSTSYTDTTISVTITTTLQCTLLIIAHAKLRTQGGASYPADVAIHNGTTQLIERSTTYQDYREETWVLRVPGQAAGVYTYKLQFKITSGSTAWLDDAGMIVIAIPE